MKKILLKLSIVYVILFAFLNIIDNMVSPIYFDDFMVAVSFIFVAYAINVVYSMDLA